MGSRKMPNPKSAGAKSSSTSTRKVSAKRARSLEPTTPEDSDASAQPKSKRSKQAKASTVEKGNTKSGSKNGSTSRATTQPMETESTPVIQANENHPPPPTYIGNFDLYNMESPFLSKLSLKKGASTSQYEDLYNMILTHQAKGENTAQFFLAPPTERIVNYLTSPAIMDPMAEYPFDIIISSFKHHASLSLPNDTLPGSPGVSASTSLGGMCGIRSSSGVFKFKRVWTKSVSPNDFTELFAGYFTFNVSYGAMYRPYTGGQKHKWGFWAVRARTGDDGMEVGLQPMLPVPVRANVGTHPVAATD